MRGVKTKHIEIDKQIGNLAILGKKIDDMAREWKIPKSSAMNIHLAVEEAVSNIILYAFPNTDNHKITISVTLENKKLTIIIIDDGIPFNPLKKEQPDITLPADERNVGGLGIFLILNIMDEVTYDRKNNQNILTLYKKI